LWYVILTMEIRFTKHAIDKFAILRRHGLIILKEKVIGTVEKPNFLDYSRFPLLIAQSDFDRNRVLRVVYKIVRQTMVIITFYPGKKSQYEKRK